MPPHDSEEQIIRYLLDELDQAERATLEERLFRETSFFEHVTAVEDDLIMQYVRGDMEGRLLPKFTEVYLGSPANQARIESARKLRRAVRDTARRRETVISRRFLFSAAGFSAVAALLLLAVWLPNWKTHIGSSSQQVKIAQVSFSLEPDLDRSGDGLQIRVPKATQAQFKLAFANAAEHASYRITLGTPEQPAIWRGTAAAQGSVIVTTVPPDVFHPGDYSLQLQASGAGNEWTTVAAYYFRVVQ